ncbi:universal stress protein PHOS34-like isoform X1 [Typha latifolia]|uniref:universal stress protein PHOS34-like isoform X1 n=1 Tax=Typha latifolia TaxID=4733 RepID=UPI003C2B49E8
MSAAVAAAAVAEGKSAAEEKKPAVVVVGVDDSERSYHALEWVLRHLFPSGGGPSGFELVIVYAKPLATSVISLSGPGVGDVLPYVDADLRKVAEVVVDKSRQLCVANSVSAVVEVVEGDARNVLCEAVEKHHAEILVVGSHGYGAIKRAVLGSVSDYCAHHAHCNVMIVKKPKLKH